jgi:hypothetical protein
MHAAGAGGIPGGQALKMRRLAGSVLKNLRCAEPSESAEIAIAYSGTTCTGLAAEDTPK